ncbi:MAG TPA: hypothetical protein EYP04_13520, partial [Anaerolineae bacterium]|nr:hypothetical protein [Anaerolineae bacterium]
MPETLTPLLYPYVAVVLHGLLEASHPLAPEVGDPYLPLQDVFTAVLVGVTWSWLSQSRAMTARLGRRDGMSLTANGLLLVGFGWAVLEYLGGAAHGATASDPYAYVQMAVDLAQRGTPLHRFHLFPLIADLGVRWWPIVHVGYHLPINPVGDAPTVWPIGWSVLLAAAYRLFGDRALYLAAPVAGLLSLIALWFLGKRALPGSLPERRLASAVAVLVLATSFEQVDRLLVPMADAAAQLFTTLTILFLWRGLEGDEKTPRPWLWVLLTGLSFGWAYFVRHTLLVLGIVLAGATWFRFRHDRHNTWTFLTWFGVGAFLAVLPDIAYRWYVFGSPLRPESPELALFSLAN